MKKQNAIDRFLDEFEAQNITQETLNALYFHLSHVHKGRPENPLRPPFMLALRQSLTVSQIARLIDKDEREIQKYLQAADQQGWSIVNLSHANTGEFQVWLNGKIDWARQKNVEITLIFDMKVAGDVLTWKMTTM